MVGESTGIRPVALRGDCGAFGRIVHWQGSAGRRVPAAHRSLVGSPIILRSGRVAGGWTIRRVGASPVRYGLASVQGGMRVPESASLRPGLIVARLRGYSRSDSGTPGLAGIRQSDYRLQYPPTWYSRDTDPRRPEAQREGDPRVALPRLGIPPNPFRWKSGRKG